MKRYTLLAFLVVVLAALADAQQPSPATAPIQIHLHPNDITLSSSADHQSVIVKATYANGLTADVTDKVEYLFSNPGIAAIEGGTIQPIRDGQTDLTVRFGGLSDLGAVMVEQAAIEWPISFKLDVMPIFMKAGCNSGSCHGSARGQDGFRLSLFGFDPVGDYFRISREFSGRRINLALPTDSLILDKATGAVPHSGGERFKKESNMYATLQRWLRAGAPRDAEDVPAPTSLEIFPKQIVLAGKGQTQQLTVRAEYSDGSDRDVTPLSVFLSNNDNCADVSDLGLITSMNSGEAFVMARFATFTVGAEVIVVPEGNIESFPENAEYNYIDALVNAKLRKLRVVPSMQCSDEAFLRRAYIDIVGMLPSSSEWQQFLADEDPQKREQLVDRLLGRKEFSEMWVMKWAELLKISSGAPANISYKSALLYYNWLQERIANNVSMDVIVKELLASTGGTFRNPATNYYQLEGDTLKVSENVAQVFMGIQTQCAQCHNHPFDRWTMDDYYGFAAFFTQIGRKAAEDPRETVIFNSGGGAVKHPVSGQAMAPKFLGGEVAQLNGSDRRAAVADWLVSPDNPYFAKNLANIVWSHFFGRGIVEPVDDVRISNPPANAALLATLGAKFIEYNYDFKKLVRDICTSHTYQRSSGTNPTNAMDSRNFSHAAIRRIRAEVLLDAISQVTETENKFRGLPLGARAVQIADGATTSYFLTTFGRAKRETVCSCEVKMEPNLSQALHLLNGETTQENIKKGKLLERLMANQKPAEEIVDELYIRCLSRRPTNKETDSLQEIVQQNEDAQLALEDVFWGLLNSKEFIFNH